MDKPTFNLSDGDWERLVATLPQLPGEARPELERVIDAARKERSEALDWPLPSDLDRQFLDVGRAATELKSKLQSLEANEFTQAVLIHVELQSAEYVATFSELPRLLEILIVEMDVAASTPKRKGPIADGLNTLIWGAAEIIERYTATLVTRSRNRSTPAKPTFLSFFHLLYEIANLSGYRGVKGANVESSLKGYITDRNASSAKPV